jgi:hypothetical protein
MGSEKHRGAPKRQAKKPSKKLKQKEAAQLAARNPAPRVESPAPVPVPVPAPSPSPTSPT